MFKILLISLAIAMVYAAPPILLTSENGNQIIRIPLEKKRPSSDTASQKLSHKSAMFEKFLPKTKKEQASMAFDIFQSITETVFGQKQSIPMEARNKFKQDFKQRLQTPAYTINLQNLEEYGYQGDLYLGSNRQVLNLFYDTGSAWTVVTGSTCSTCTSTKYDPATSTSFQLVSNSEIDLNYGQGTYVCYTGRDTVSLDSAGTYAAIAFKFAIAKSQSGFNDEQGIIGMSQAAATGTEYSGNGPKLMQALKNSNIITNNIFGFMLTTQDHQSFIEIGDYSLSFLRDSAYMKWFPQTIGDFFWTFPVQGLRYTETDKHPDYPDLTTNYKIYETMAIADTGTSLAYLPSSQYKSFMNLIIKGHEEALYYSYQGLYTGTCDITKYKTVYLYADGTYIGITPKNYILVIEDGEYDECLIGFAEFTGYDAMLIGDVFLREFYSVWDDQNNRFGLSPNIYSTAQMADGAAATEYLPDSSSYSEETTSSYLPTIATVSGTTAVFSLIGSLIYLVYFKI